MYFNLEEIVFYNLYMQNAENYNKLKNNLRTMNLSFCLGDILKIDSNAKYGLIICSNVIEHTYIPECNLIKLKKLFAGLKNSLTKEGLLLATYIYAFYNEIAECYDTFPIKGTDIISRELLKEELIEIDSYKNVKDAVLVLRK